MKTKYNICLILPEGLRSIYMTYICDSLKSNFLIYNITVQSILLGQIEVLHVLRVVIQKFNPLPCINRYIFCTYEIIITSILIYSSNDTSYDHEDYTWLNYNSMDSITIAIYHFENFYYNQVIN